MASGGWDGTLKVLAKQAPQDIVSWLMEGAVYEEEVSAHLNSRNIHADLLYRIRMGDQVSLLHIEFQVRAESGMAERMWEYNVLATIQNRLPIYSFVIYLKKVNVASAGAYCVQGYHGRTIHMFYYDVIKLWEVPTEQVKKLGLKGILPLLPLTREGKQRAVVDEMLTALCRNEKQERLELLSLAYALASLTFRSNDDQNWLKWRFSMLDDLIEESWALQEIMQKGWQKGVEDGKKQGEEKWRKEGIKEGRKEGIKEGIKQEHQAALMLSRQTLLALVEHRYPTLLVMSRARVETITDLAVLQNLMLQISLASYEAEVRSYLDAGQ